MDAGDIANIATAVAVIVALLFGIIQLRQAQSARRDQALAAFVQTWLDPSFGRAVELVFALPDGARAEDVRRAGPETVEAARQVIHIWETMGWMTYRRVILLASVEQMSGGYVRASWRKLRGFVEAERAGSANAGEWFQWLVERMDEHPVEWKKLGAHVALRDWKP